jgi:MraZ protein
MFRGTCPTRLDDKGRLKIPADFKHVVDKEFNGRFYITSLDGQVVKLYPMQAWEKLEAEVGGKSSSYAAREHFVRKTSQYGQETEMDAQGRLTISDWLREKFGLKGEVAVIGMWDHLELRLMEQLGQIPDDAPAAPAWLEELLGKKVS